LQDEVLDLFPAGLSKRLRAAEFDGVGLYQFGIELVLPNDLAESVADLRASAVPIAICTLWWTFFNRTRKCSDFLDRAESDAVGFAQGTIDGTRFGYTHFSAADKRRNIGWISIAITNEAFARFGFIDRSLECPALCRRLAEGLNWLNFDASAPIPAGEPQ
jgi:hypothetical protein